MGMSDDMGFNDMVKMQRAKNNGLSKSVFANYPMYAEDYVARDIENRDLCIESNPQDALLEYDYIYDDDGEIRSLYVRPGIDATNYSEILMDNGEVINTLYLGRRKKINLDEIKGIITWSEGYLSIYGDVHLSIDEDDLTDQTIGENKVDEKDVVVTYLPSF